MEIVVSQSDGMNSFEQVTDCERFGDDEYEITKLSGETQRISGTIVAALPFYNNRGTGQPDYESIVVRVLTEGTLRTPVEPLSANSDIEDAAWVYDDNYVRTTPPEVEPTVGRCILRNVCGFAHSAVSSSLSDKDVLQLHEGDGHTLKVDERSLNFSGPFAAQFGSAWVSGPIKGQVGRITSYKDRASDETIYPNEQTREHASWAF